METPSPEDVRAALAKFDNRHQKIVIGMLTMMVRDPKRVREPEWISERLTEVTLLAGDFEADSPHEGVRAVQEFLAGSSVELLRASYMLFQRVGLDLAPHAAEGFTLEDALRCGLSYVPGFAPAAEADGAPAGVSAEESAKASAPAPAAGVRDLGEQPLARLMAERDLKPADLVSASSEQLTHRMVTRAMKGRRLTANAMGKVHRAWDQAAGRAHSRDELFNYEP